MHSSTRPGFVGHWATTGTQKKKGQSGSSTTKVTAKPDLLSRILQIALDVLQSNVIHPRQRARSQGNVTMFGPSFLFWSLNHGCMWVHRVQLM